MTTSSQPVGDKPTVFCVFCASSSGINPVHLESARALAHAMHENNIHLVYGGGTKGIMGEIAKTLVKLSGPDAVHGIIPGALIQLEPGVKEASATEDTKAAERSVGQEEMDKLKKGAIEISESEYGKTTVVPDMHTRKRMMAAQVLNGGPGSGFVALAGGYGTLEEVAEMVTWNQLGIHKRGIVLVNIDGVWDGIIDWVKRSVQEGFVGVKQKDIIVEVKDVNHVVEALRNYQVAEGRYKLNWGQE